MEIWMCSKDHRWYGPRPTCPECGERGGRIEPSGQEPDNERRARERGESQVLNEK